MLSPRWANIVLAGTGLVVFLTFLVIVVAGPNLSSAVTEVKKGNDAATCRSQFSAAVTDARTALDGAKTDVVSAEFDGMVAGLVAKNTQGLQAAVIAGENAKREASHWKAEVDAANNAYQRLLRLEVTDHAAFTDLCDRGPSR